MPTPIAAIAALMALLLACQATRTDAPPPAPEPTTSAASVLARPASSDAAERERAARRDVQDARAFLIQGRHEAALRATTRGLLAEPDDPGLLRARARALDALGRAAEASEARDAAARLDPPPPPLPGGPLPGRFDDLLIVLQRPDVDLSSARATRDARHARQLEDGLVARLELRLPGVRLVPETGGDAPTVPAARTWLQDFGRPRVAGVRILRALCGESVKDGRYAVASIHRTLAAPTFEDGPVRASGRPERAPGERSGESQPASEACPARALDRAVETWLEADAGFFAPDDDHAADTPPALPRTTVLVLLPGLEAQVRAEHAAARRAVYVGDLARARTAYERAEVLDPEDRDIAAHVAEIDATLKLNRELARLEAERERERRSVGDASQEPRRQAADEAGWLPAVLTPAQQAALEGQLESERRRRDDLLATLATVSGDRRLAHVPQAARRSTVAVDVSSAGARRALARLDPGKPGASDGPASERLAVRTLYGPSGALVARYYFDARALDAPSASTVGEAAELEEGPLPILAEEDATGDGVVDRWTAYRAGLRSEVWEQRRDEAVPDLHVFYADDGRTLVRLELDGGVPEHGSTGASPHAPGATGRAYDGVADRVYEYEGGVLVRAARDTDGDGRLDRYDHFDGEGRVTLREEDLTGDGRIDVRSTFQDGRLVRRELMEPEAARIGPGGAGA